MRKKILARKSNLMADSHASIAEYCFENSHEEDNYNAWSFNPFTDNLVLTNKNQENDERLIDRKRLKKIVLESVPELILKPVFNPLKDKSFDDEITPEILDLLKEWKNVYRTVLCDNTGKYNSDIITEIIKDSVGSEVYYLCRTSVYRTSRYMVSNQVWDTLQIITKLTDNTYAGDYFDDLTEANADAFLSSFFSLERWGDIKSEPYENPFSSCIKLWELGLVPSFDGRRWRLNSYKGIVYEE